MKWARHRPGPAKTPRQSQGGTSPEQRLLNISRSFEQFAVNFQANAEELKAVAADAAQRLREEGEHGTS